MSSSRILISEEGFRKMYIEDYVNYGYLRSVEEIVLTPDMAREIADKLSIWADEKDKANEELANGL